MNICFASFCLWHGKMTSTSYFFHFFPHHTGKITLASAISVLPSSQGKIHPEYSHFLSSLIIKEESHRVDIFHFFPSYRVKPHWPHLFQISPRQKVKFKLTLTISFTLSLNRNQVTLTSPIPDLPPSQGKTKTDINHCIYHFVTEKYHVDIIYFVSSPIHLFFYV